MATDVITSTATEDTRQEIKRVMQEHRAMQSAVQGLLTEISGLKFQLQNRDERIKKMEQHGIELDDEIVFAMNIFEDIVMIAKQTNMDNWGESADDVRMAAQYALEKLNH